MSRNIYHEILPFSHTVSEPWLMYVSWTDLHTQVNLPTMLTVYYNFWAKKPVATTYCPSEFTATGSSNSILEMVQSSFSSLPWRWPPLLPIVISLEHLSLRCPWRSWVQEEMRMKGSGKYTWWALRLPSATVSTKFSSNAQGIQCKVTAWYKNPVSVASDDCETSHVATKGITMNARHMSQFNPWSQNG